MLSKCYFCCCFLALCIIKAVFLIRCNVRMKLLRHSGDVLVSLLAPAVKTTWFLVLFCNLVWQSRGKRQDWNSSPSSSSLFFFYHCCKMWGGYSSIFWWQMKPTSDLQSTFLSDHVKNICHSLPRHKIYRFPFMAVSVVCSLQWMLHILKTVCMGLETKEPPKKADMLLLQRLCVCPNVEFSSAVEQQQNAHLICQLRDHLDCCSRWLLWKGPYIHKCVWLTPGRATMKDKLTDEWSECLAY